LPAPQKHVGKKRDDRSKAVSAAWTVRDCEGQLLPGLVGASPLEVGRKIVPRHYDEFRLHVSASYREVFDRDLSKVLAHNNWQIVRVKSKRRAKAGSSRAATTLN
jgi:hypothetical protein